MKMVVLQREDMQAPVQRFVQGIAEELSKTQEVQIQSTYQSASTDEMIVVFGPKGMEQAQNIKENSPSSMIVAVCSEVTQDIRDKADTVDYLLVPSALQDEEEQAQALLLHQDHQSKVLETVEQKDLQSEDSVKTIAGVLAQLNQPQNVSALSEWKAAANTWANKASTGAFQFYANNRSAINWTLGIGALSGLLVAGARTETGRAVVETASDTVRSTFGMGSGSSSNNK